jgi:hypothetical protein
MVMVSLAWNLKAWLEPLTEILRAPVQTREHQSRGARHRHPEHERQGIPASSILAAVRCVMDTSPNRIRN